MLFMLYDIIISRTFYVILLHHVTYVTVTCDVTFCLLCLCPSKEKEKETQNKIKENKRKGK